MTRSRAWLLLIPCTLLLLPLGPAGRAADLATLKGKNLSGDLVRITDKGVVLNVGGKEVETPLDDVLILNVAAPTKLPSGAKPTELELVDGTKLLVENLRLKKTEATFTAVGGKEARSVPISVVASVLNNAQDADIRKRWNEILSDKRDRDLVVRVAAGNINPFKGTIGESNEDGTSFEFTLASGPKVRQTLDSMIGLVFFRAVNPLAPPINLRLTDTDGNLYMVNALKVEGETLTAATSSGVEFKVPLKQLAKLDYSKGKQTFLANMIPTRKVLESASGERFAHLLADKNLNGTGPMRLMGEQYTRGLAMFTYTDLEYTLKGDYNEFRAVAGIDDEVGGADGGVHLLIEGDGRELLSVTFNRQDKVRAQPISLNIKDVNVLRIVVSDPDGKDIGKHLNLANAQVTK